MKSLTIILGLIVACSCQKELTDVTADEALKETFTEYIIKAGAHYSNNSGPMKYEGNMLKFTVVFDSSAIYTTTLPENQDDINKLYGFSDNNKHHHQYSARFGWRYSNGKLRLFAYVYNNGQRLSEELAIIEPGKPYECAIVVQDNQYIFQVEGKELLTTRAATTKKAEGYKLFPYFGGDEPAPHDIRILIREKYR